MSDYAKERAAAIDAVRAAARVCRAVQARLVTAETLEKKDKSPVTVADFASQAIVCQRLAAALPDDRVVGEEGADDLRGDENTALRDQVVSHTAEVVGEASLAGGTELGDRRRRAIGAQVRGKRSDPNTEP